MRIEYGYDMHVKSWNICVFDDNDDEVASEYVGNLHDCQIVINDFKEEYHTNNVKKVKAY